jgi:hypothetical protein
LSWCTFEGSLESIEQEIQELLGIFLLGRVGRATVELFEGKAELPRVVVLSFGELEVGHELLQLVQHVVVDGVSFVLLNIVGLIVIDAKEIVPESSNIKELLKHRVHVANATQVSKTNKLLASSGSRGWSIVPGLCPLDVGHERLHALFKEILHKVGISSEKTIEQSVSCALAFAA